MSSILSRQDIPQNFKMAISYPKEFALLQLGSWIELMWDTTHWERRCYGLPGACSSCCLACKALRARLSRSLTAHWGGFVLPWPYNALGRPGWCVALLLHVPRQGKSFLLALTGLSVVGHAQHAKNLLSWTKLLLQLRYNSFMSAVMSRSSRLGVVKVNLNGIGWRGLSSLPGPASIPRECGAWKELQVGRPSLSLSQLTSRALPGRPLWTAGSFQGSVATCPCTSWMSAWVAEFPVGYFTSSYSELLVAWSQWSGLYC